MTCRKYSAATKVAYRQVAQLSQRDRAAGWVSFGRKWKTGSGRRYFVDIIGLFSATISAGKAVKFGENSKIRAITAFKVIQGHLCRCQSKARVRLPISDYY